MATRYCKNCIHFTPNNECMRFKCNDLVYGTVKYQNVRVARYTPSLCGERALHYKERPQISYERVMNTYSHDNSGQNTDKLTGIVTPVIVCSAEGCSIVYNSGGFDDNEEVVYMGMEYDNDHTTTLNDVY